MTGLEEGKRRPKISLGNTNRRFTLSDLVAVSTHQGDLEIESTALEALATGVPTAKGNASVTFTVPPPEPVATKGEVLAAFESRAVVVARLVSLIQGRSGVRREVIELLVSLLNKGVSPVFHSMSAAQELAAFVSDGSSILSPSLSSPYPTTSLSSAGLTPIENLTQGEAAALATGTFASVGPAALQAYAVLSLSQVIDALAAVTCEATKASLEPFQAVHFDIHRPHRGQMASASSLRLCLEGSTLVRSIPTTEGEIDPEAIRCIPQIHGPCREIIDVGIKSLEVELNSAEGQGAAAGSYHPAQVDIVLKNLQRALNVLVQASQARCQVLQQQQQLQKQTSTISSISEDGDNHLQMTSVEQATLIFGTELSEGREVGRWVGTSTSTRTISSTSDGDNNHYKITSVEQATLLFGTELSEALKQLKALEDAAAAAVEAKKKKEQNKAPLPPEADGQQMGGGRSSPGDVEDMDPVKKARIEAARKAKADKAAAKAAAKAAKKVTSLVLGMGTREMRDWITKITKGSLEAEALAVALGPLVTGSESAAEMIRTMIERLGSGGQQRRPKIAKGTRDFGEEQMVIREEAFGIIRRIFKLHGAKEIDTPVFELKETLTGKYGEDSKLIYDLADQGGELLSLRYDLTVPFARYIAMYNPGNLKRYHIAKVYRRDNPAISRGRFREFYQCDFDIAGSYPLMVPDAEVITVAVEILSSLPIGTFEIKLNHRKLLDSIFDICGVPPEKFRTICSAVDKMDKESWEEVRREMTEEKGLRAEVADKIGTFVQYKGSPKDLHAKLVEGKVFGTHAGAVTALGELGILFDYLEALDSLKAISFDLSLARGLDYYTGVIYEAVLTAKDSVVGSIAAGGRYDNLVGMFSASGQQTPCVGVSIGIERVLTIMEARRNQEQQEQIATVGRKRSPFVEVLVATIGAGMLPQRMRLAKALWHAGIPAEYLPQDNPKLKKQMEYAHEAGIPYLVIVGSDEMKKGVVKVKDPSKPQEESEEEVTEAEMAANLIAKGARVIPSLVGEKS